MIIQLETPTPTCVVRGTHGCRQRLSIGQEQAVQWGDVCRSGPAEHNVRSAEGLVSAAKFQS